MALKRRHHLRKSSIRELSEKLKSKFGTEAEDLIGNEVEVAETESGAKVILSDGEPTLATFDDEFIPLIPKARSLPLKRVTVDMGAVRPITDGADVMAPGIVDANDEIAQGELVGIEDERHHKLIAVGTSLVEGSSMPGREGKIIKNLHHVGDKFWELCEG